MDSINIVLAMKDKDDLKKVTMVFREMGLVPAVCFSLADLWSLLLLDKPDLVICDVMCMSDEHRILKDHPEVKNDNVPLVFYYQQKTKALVHSTFDYFHLGLIEKELSLKGQLKNIIKRLNTLAKIETHLVGERKNKNQLFKMMSLLKEDYSILKLKEMYRQKLSTLQKDFKNKHKYSHFYEILFELLNDFTEIFQYAIYELGVDLKRVTSPLFPIPGQRYALLEPFEFHQNLDNGLTATEQSVLIHKAMDQMGQNILPLFLTSPENENKIHKILFLKINNESLLNYFPWNDFEYFLNELHEEYYENTSGIPKISHFEAHLSAWKWIEIVSQYYLKPQVHEESCILTMDFSEIFQNLLGRQILLKDHHVKIEAYFQHLIQLFRERQCLRELNICVWSPFQLCIFLRAKHINDMDIQYHSLTDAAIKLNSHAFLFQREGALTHTSSFPTDKRSDPLPKPILKSLSWPDFCRDYLGINDSHNQLRTTLVDHEPNRSFIPNQI